MIYKVTWRCRFGGGQVYGFGRDAALFAVAYKAYKRVQAIHWGWPVLSRCQMQIRNQYGLTINADVHAYVSP